MDGLKPVLFVLSFFVASSSFAMILPKNDLHRFDRREAISNVTKEEFERVTDTIIALWQPYAQKHGAKLIGVKRWDDSTVNAYAEQRGSNWYVTMFGGLARRPEVTVDGFAMVVCHELGHHFGGYAFYNNNDWAASEGQSDYFATQVCARKIWSRSFKKNATHFRQNRNLAGSLCERTWRTPEDIALCMRTADAGQSLANLLAAAGGEKMPKVETPDPRQVSKTDPRHPRAQCRLDTYMSGALCPENFDLNIIPGRNNKDGQLSATAEAEAATFSCTSARKFEIGVRPRCWFKPVMN